MPHRASIFRTTACAAMVGCIALVVACRSQETPPASTRTPPRDGIPNDSPARIDGAASTTPVTTTAAPDAPTTAAPDAPTTAAPDAPTTTTIDAGPQDACAIACQFARDCALGTATCEADCRKSADLRACLELAGPTECGRAAACGLRVMCGGKEPRGTGTCKAAMTCQSQCPAGDLGCGCGCVPAMAAHHALALARVDVCAINCGYDEACMRARCAVWALACAGK